MSKRFTDGNFALGLIAGGALAIILAVWLIGLNYCPESPCNYDYKHSHGPSNSPQKHQGLIPRPDLPNYTLQTEPEFSKGYPKEYEYADLTAQENMARATNWIAWFSFLGFIAAGAGVVLLVRNLDVTREVGRDQTRAYVHVDQISLSGSGQLVKFQATVKNFGNTPAHWFSVEYIIYPYKDANIGPPSYRGDKIEPRGTSKFNALGPGAELTLPIGPRNGEKIQLNPTTDSLVIQGYVRYKTVFSEVFESQFSFIARDFQLDSLQRSNTELETYKKIN